MGFAGSTIYTRTPSRTLTPLTSRTIPGRMKKISKAPRDTPPLFTSHSTKKKEIGPLLSILYSAKITWCRGKYIPQTGDGDEYRDESRVIHKQLPQGKNGQRLSIAAS